jgi:uncharacterized protein YdaU (DUF1376 family)
LAKAPAFQFYPGDYIRDTRILSLEARGAWCDLLCMMWFAEERGKCNGEVTQLSRLWNTEKEATKAILDELIKCKILDVVTNGNGEVTLISRRMIRDEKDRIDNAKRQGKYREKHKSDDKSNGKVTKSNKVSSSSSSSSLKKDISLTDDEWLENLKTSTAYNHINFEVELSKMDTWLSLPKNKRRKKTRTFILNWLNKIEKPFTVEKHPPVPTPKKPAYFEHESTVDPRVKDIVKDLEDKMKMKKEVSA